MAENAKTLKGGCHIAVGTPGRVRFLMNKGVLHADTARLLVLESADWLVAPVFLVGFLFCFVFFVPCLFFLLFCFDSWWVWCLFWSVLFCTVHKSVLFHF